MVDFSNKLCRSTKWDTMQVLKMTKQVYIDKGNAMCKKTSDKRKYVGRNHPGKNTCIICIYLQRKRSRKDINFGYSI